MKCSITHLYLTSTSQKRSFFETSLNASIAIASAIAAITNALAKLSSPGTTGLVVEAVAALISTARHARATFARMSAPVAGILALWSLWSTLTGLARHAATAIATELAPVARMLALRRSL